MSDLSQLIEEEVDGVRVHFSTYPFMQGMKMKRKLVGIVGPALGELISAVKGGSTENLLDAEFDLSGIGSAIAVILETLPENKMEELIKHLLTGVFVGGVEMNTPQRIDDAFSMKYEMFYKVVGLILKKNYAGFFKFLRSAHGLIQKKAPSIESLKAE